MRTVLAVVEPAVHPQAVVERAAWIARLTESRLLLLLSDPDVRSWSRTFLVSNEAREIADNIREAQEAIIDELVAPVRAGGLEVRSEILTERPVADGVMQRALEAEPLMIVKGTTYHSQAQRAIFVDTDWSLVRSSPYPLWLVKPQDLAATPVVVAAVDPTHEDDEHAELDRLIVEQADEIAGKAGGELLIVHTFERLTGIGAEATRTFKPIRLPVDELSERMEQAERKKLDALARSFDIDPRRVHQLPGRAREVLPWFARERKADLVVMGAIARWGLRKAIIGSTAEHVLDDLPCDILIVKRPG
jgi:universal stress protein E